MAARNIDAMANERKVGVGGGGKGADRKENSFDKGLD